MLFWQLLGRERCVGSRCLLWCVALASTVPARTHGRAAASPGATAATRYSKAAGKTEPGRGRDLDGDVRDG
eukprot:1924436-Pleurochrysis_carterae.AAC.3